MNGTQRNVLEAMIDMTTITRGKNRGNVKHRIVDPYEMFYARPLNALVGAGYISCRVDQTSESVDFVGYAATRAGIEAIDNAKKSN